MARTSKRGSIISDINVTPLVDIMLVLLVVFMLTTQLIERRAIEVELPRATQGADTPPTTLAITVQAGGDIYLGDKAVNADQLRAAIQDAVAHDPKTQAIIAGDKNVAHGRIVWVLDTVKSLGITQFAIQIDPAAIAAPGTGV